MSAKDSAKARWIPTSPVASYLALRADLSACRRGEGGPEVCAALTAEMDTCLATLAAPLAGQRVAVVAVGGYGRGELCLQSDIDVLLLHGGRLSPGTAEAVFYPLWDAGLKVGHAVRSVKESLTAAHERLETLTALLDARLVAGEATLLTDFSTALGNDLRRGRVQLSAPLAQAEQVRRASEPYQLLEVDIKAGRGGLRALQALEWEWRRLLLSESSAYAPATKAELAAHATLLATRNALHAVSGRPYDLYAFDLRRPVATWLDLDPDPASRRLYQALRTVDALAGEYWSQLGGSRVLGRWAGVGTRGSGVVWRLSAVGGPRPETRDPTPTPLSPLTLAAATLDRPAGDRGFTPEERTYLRTAGGAVWDAADRQALLRLLAAGQHGWEAFSALETGGCLSRVLPEWRHVVAAPQHVPFHLHPVDVHLWRTVIELLTITRSGSDEPWCADVATELSSLDDALLAALLHDIGKGWPGDHSVIGAAAAAAVLSRTGFGPAMTGTITRIVRQHLLLPTIATRRDIDDPAVVLQVADLAGSLRALRILYLLAVADARATGPLVWSPWKASLVRSLFLRAAEVLAHRDSSAPPLVALPSILTAVQTALQDRIDRAVIVEHVEAMPPSYLTSFSVPELVRHLQLVVPPPQRGRVVVDVRAAVPAATVVVVAQDYPGLLAIISGVFALHNVSILEGRFYTRADGIVLDSFHVEDALGNMLDDRRWSRVREDMTRAIHGELALEQLLREKAYAYRHVNPHPASPVRGRGVEVAAVSLPVEVMVDVDGSDSLSVVEVHCGDRIGLLSDIARVLFEVGLDIRLAKIDTRGREVVDSFYVHAVDDESLRDPERRTMIAQQVRECLLAGR
ncbi:MAG: ACT domain-containing protein [Dehalococcoidia bacterium]